MARGATPSLCRTRLCPASQLTTQPLGRSPMTSATRGSMGASIFDSTKWQAVAWDGRSGPRFTGTTCVARTNPNDRGELYPGNREVPRMPYQLLGQTDAPHQVYKTRVAADRVKKRMHFDEFHNHRVFLIGAIEPDKGLLVIAESEVRVKQCRRRNVAFLLSPF